MQTLSNATPAAFSHKLLSSAASIASAQNVDVAIASGTHCKRAPLRSVPRCQAQRDVRAQAIAAPANVESESSLKVSISNRGKENWTAIKIEAENQPGLLTKITSTLR